MNKSTVDNKVLMNNTISLILMQVFNFLPLIVILFLAKLLGVEKYGFIMSIFAIATFSSVFVDYGFNISATYKISKHAGNCKYIYAISSNVITIRVIISLLLFIVFSIDYLLTKIVFKDFIVVVYVFAIIFFQSLISDWFFQGIEKMRNIAIYTILIRTIYALSVLFFIKTPQDADYVIIFWVISNAVGAFFSIILMQKQGFNYVLPTLRDIGYEVKEGWLFFKSRLFVSLYTTIKNLLLGIVNPIYLAYYSLGDQAFKASQSVTSPINSALYPYMVRTKNWKIFFRIFMIILSLMIIAESLIIYYAADIISLFFGKSYNEAILSFKVFMITAGVTYIGVTFGNPAFGALNKIHIPNKISVYAFYLHFSVIIFLYMTNNINHLTIAIALLCTELFVAILRVYFFIRCYTNEVNIFKETTV